MFRSKSTYEEYLNSLQDEVGAPDDLNLNDIEDHILRDIEASGDVHGNEEECANESDESDKEIVIPEGFNDDEEILIVDGLGNVKIQKGRISVNFVYSLDTHHKILVPFNKFYQPIKKAGTIFNRFLADVAKRPNLCPLNYKEWRVVPQPFKDRIIFYIRTKFMIPSGERVRTKVLSLVGDRLRGYKRFLRRMYIKENTTKDELYQLPSRTDNDGEMLTRPKGVPDSMWYGFVDLCFSENFKKYSTIGKKSRGQVLHPHTSGSQSFAIKRDKFEKENRREPGPIEWFQETHQTKDKKYHNIISQQFVDTALKIVQQKTNSDEVTFSKDTIEAETYAYKKLMGSDQYGRVRGFGTGVYNNDLQDQNIKRGYDTCSLVLQKMHDMEKLIANIVTKDNRQDVNDTLSENVEDLAPSKHDGNTLRSNKRLQDDLNVYGSKEKLHVTNQGDTEHISREIVKPPRRPTQVIKSPTVPPNPNKENVDMVMEKGEGVILPSRDVQGGGRIPLQLFPNGSKPRILAPSLNQTDQLKKVKESFEARRNMENYTSGRQNQTSKASTPSTTFKAKDGGPRKPITTQMGQNFSSCQNDSIGEDVPLRFSCQPTEKGQGDILSSNTSHVDQQARMINKVSEKGLVQSLEKRNAKRQKQTSVNQMSREEICGVVDKVLKDNPGYVNRYNRGDKREYIHCYLVGVVAAESKQRANNDIVAEVLWEKLDNFKFLHGMKASCRSKLAF